MKLSFNKSPVFCPAEYDTIIPGGGGYYIGIFRYWTDNGRPPREWHARIIDKDLRHRIAGFEFSSRTKRELVSWLSRHLEDLRKATEALDC